MMHSQTANHLIPTASVSKPHASFVSQRKCACGGHDVGLDGECAECRKKKLQRRAARPDAPMHAPPIVHHVLHSLGAPLDDALRASMEARFGHDFSRVRIHSGARAAESAQAVNALAYTVGNDIVFGAGQYAPATHAGKKLLAHELAHTVQQSAAGVSSVAPSSLEVTAAQSAAETECDAVAERIVNLPDTANEPLPISQTTAASVQRVVSPKLPRIQYLLRERRRGEKKISAQDAHEALEILSWLGDQDMRDTVAEMEKGGYVDRLFLNLSEEDQRNNYHTLRRIKNARVHTRTHKQGDITVTTTVVGSCSPEQFTSVSNAATLSLNWLDSAVSQLDAYLAAPAAATNEQVGRALQLHFHTTTADVTRHIRGRLNVIRQDMRGLVGMEIECHGFWDKTCDEASAYVPAWPRERIIFCNSFFERDGAWQAHAVIHEMAHTQVGGARILDFAYADERLIRYLTTPEALTNAESFGLLVRQLGTGKVPKLVEPKDRSEDCPDRWWQMLQRATGIAQRWSNSAQAAFSNLKAKDLASWTSEQVGYLGGKTEGDVSRARRVYESMKKRIAKRIDFECEPKGGGRCDDDDVYWYALGDYHICPSWINTPKEGDRVEVLLQGLYGYAGDVDDRKRRENYAKLARSIGEHYAPDTVREVIGSSQWSPDLLTISLTQREPKAAKYAYYEDAKFHTRLSDDMPVYQGPAGTSSTLPFDCSVEFTLDEPNKPRPSPFTPPTVRTLFEFNGANDPFSRQHEDKRPIYTSGGSPLQTSFLRQQHFSFKENGAFHMNFELDDPDTRIKRVYDDTIQIEAVR